MSRRMPRGVRKVNENIIQDGRSLIINEENEKIYHGKIYLMVQ